MGPLTLRVTPRSLGGVTISITDWTPLLAGAEVAFGYEDFDVLLPTPVNAVGFEVVEPPDQTDSQFTASLFKDDLLVGTFPIVTRNGRAVFWGLDRPCVQPGGTSGGRRFRG